MQTHVTFRHMEASDAVKKYIESKIEKFKKFLHEPVEVHVVLQVEKIRQMAEITVSAKNSRFHSVEESHDLYASIDLVVDKMEGQLRKHKEKVKEHKNVASTYEAAQLLAAREGPAE